MSDQYRSPTRKPVDTGRPVNYSQPQRRQIEHNPEDGLAQSIAGLALDNDDDDDYGMVGASAERSPGRISGRNRDTKMFDPSAKRGTYLPYGGFDSIIDEYYTEGDPSSITIPAPSQLQKREQSRSPQRMADQSSSPPRGRLQDGEVRRINPGMDFASRPNLPRKLSATSGHSSKTGSVHNSPPARQHLNKAPINPRQMQTAPRADQYYDDESYYVNEQAHTQAAPYPEEFPETQHQNSGYDQRGASTERRMRPVDGTNYQRRDRYDPGSTGPNGPRGPPLRMQRSMDFPASGRPAARENGHDRAMNDPRRNMGPPRDPRAIQQDPRLAPRPTTSQDARRQQSLPRQQMRPNFEQPQDEDRSGRPTPPTNYDDRPYDGRTQGRMQRPIRDDKGMPGPGRHAESYPNRGPMSLDQQQQPPLERLRAPPGPRQPDPRMQLAPRQPSPATNGIDRGSSPSNVRPLPQNGASRQAQMAGPSGQRSQQPQPSNYQQQQQQRPLPSDLSQPPRAPSSIRSNDASEMALHPEPVGVVTMQEIQALRREVTKTNTPAVQLTLVKRLMEAAVVLASEGGKADAKTTKKNRDDYSREALRTLKQLTAQEKPYTEAVFFLANCYGNGSLALEVDHVRAFALYEQAAKLQHAASAYRTAVCLEIGAGTRQDPERAVRFYRRAAEYGDPAAMYKIGMILLRGLLEESPDPKAAIMWLQKAADKADVDNPHALHELALLYEKGDQAAGFPQDEAHAKELFTKAAKLHYAPSQFRLGYAYEYGTLGCPVDPRRSIAWFSRGAERGDPESELSLSGWYLTGSDGVLAQNDREAYLWGRKAAEKGLAKAEFAVGYFFESGIGTNVDLDEAIKWYKRAATAGQKKAQERLLALGKRKR